MHRTHLDRYEGDAAPRPCRCCLPGPRRVSKGRVFQHLRWPADDAAQAEMPGRHGLRCAGTRHCNAAAACLKGGMLPRCAECFSRASRACAGRHPLRVWLLGRFCCALSGSTLPDNSQQLQVRPVSRVGQTPSPTASESALLARARFLRQEHLSLVP
jgi:hypothetical protein